MSCKCVRRNGYNLQMIEVTTIICSIGLQFYFTTEYSESDIYNSK